MAGGGTGFPSGRRFSFYQIRLCTCNSGAFSSHTLGIEDVYKRQLQGRFNARTVTKRKYPGPAPVPVEPALPHLWHGPVRSLSFTKTVFSEIRGHGGSVTQRVPLRIRVSFYSIFNLHEACLNLGSL